MRFEVACGVAAPVERVWAWWTDFGEPGASFRVTHGLGSSQRRVLTSGDGVVVFEDRSILGNVRRTVRILPDRRLLETGEGGQRFESEWRFEAAGEGRTRVTRTMRLRAHPLLKPFSLLVTRQDLRHHCRQAERELGEPT